MKVTVCDICSKGKGTLVHAAWKTTFKKGIEKFSIDLCESHRGWSKGIGYDTALDIFINMKPGGE